MDTSCPVCGRPVHRKPGPGRPAVYDRESCRRAAERQRLRRLQHLGAAVEADVRHRQQLHDNLIFMAEVGDPLGLEVVAARIRSFTPAWR